MSKLEAKIETLKEYVEEQGNSGDVDLSMGGLLQMLQTIKEYIDESIAKHYENDHVDKK